MCFWTLNHNFDKYEIQLFQCFEWTMARTQKAVVNVEKGILLMDLCNYKKQAQFNLYKCLKRKRSNLNRLANNTGKEIVGLAPIFEQTFDCRSWKQSEATYLE